MTVVHVIVHQGSVREVLKHSLPLNWKTEAIRVLNEIDQIRNSCEVHEVRDGQSPEIIPLTLPLPSDNLEVVVSGE